MESTTSPEEPVSFEISKQKNRADVNTVQQNINNLSLRSGPADVPSFHDFHHLQVAFEPTWQEAIDQGAIQIARDAYHRLVELGIDPEETISGDGECPNFKDPETWEEAKDKVIRAFDITWEQWNALDHGQKDLLESIAQPVLVHHQDESLRKMLQKQGERIIRYATSKLIAGNGEYDHLHKLLTDLKNRLKSKYSFTPFAANCKERSVNFGILVTYRQKWDPINYQVGELVSTITLAPKEVRKISKKIVHKEKRSKKEVEKSIISQKEYATEKSKAEDKIINKALAKTNFSQSAEGAFKIDVVNMTSKTSFSKEAQKSSKDVKKNFHESVVKSVHEYKQERNVEVNTEESELFETSESSEIMNPNDEIPVTFLFYELQRRYRISEQIHRAMPVIFVAQEVPRPDQLDEAWLTIHSWIIRRVSLDDTIVLPALKYLSSNVAGDEVALKELRKNIEQQRRIVEELREQLIALREKSDFLNSTLELAIYQKAGLIEEPQNEGSGGGGLLSSFIDTISDTVESTIDSIKGFSPAYNLYKLSDSLLGNGDEKDRDPLDIARDAADRATKRTNELRRILESEESSLASMAGKYTRQLSDHLNRRTQISTLLAHIKQNILYYMQAIWLHEPTDQRICRLRNVKVPVLNGKKKYTFGKKMGPEVFAFDVDMEIEPNFEFTTLEEVADLNNLMGFMCNYMVFPLKGSNALTDFMLEPYKDSLYELRDPDESGNGNLLDFAKLVCCLKKNDPEKFEDEDFKSKLKEQYETLKDSYRNDSEETVIPTDSLYIEALPGEHPILENFKLLHRAIDVKKVQAEVRGEELENLRLAARLLSGEYEDPDIDKKIVVEGDTQNVTVSTDDP